KMASRQHSKTLNIQSRRGDIYDRNSKELAVSIEVDSVFAQSRKVASPREAARVLAPMLSMSGREIEEKIRSASGFVWLKRKVDLNDAQREALKDLDGIGITKESRRYYPNRQLAANVIGFTGMDSNGLEGVELNYDKALKGASRQIKGSKDARGRVLLFEDIDKTVPVEGRTVELTIDKTLQYIAEKELKKAVESSRAKGGTAVIMDPSTGEILAMASRPTYDPNGIQGFSARDWRNRNVTDVFEPGSTFKIFLISAALEEKIVSPSDIIYCENGSYQVADRVFHDTKKHGWLSVPQIIRYSSNIGSAKIGERLGREQLYRYLKAFGFGAKTGIDLPGETRGSLRHYKSWSGVTIDTISFGQGVSASSVQLVTALSAIANGGFLMKPYVVKSVKEPNGAVVSETHPVIVRRVVSEETASLVTEMLIGVTKDGTGVNAAIGDFEVAGKTGTAQKPDLTNGGYMRGVYLASFMGFVPAHDPRLAILVTIDESQGDYHGGTVAAPAFREIAAQGLSYMGVFPHNPASPKVQFVKGPAAGNDAGREKDAERYRNAVPDFSGKTIRAVLRLAAERSLDVEIKGSGRAVSQRPAPGQSIPANGRAFVAFQ
ncbi:MAG: penicillin-binding transpeptidase domain-containing protein, partial [Deltaproteobacteria bacterium]|nr:penicillin-binding transpeptidase domain-containing protein [Deltaproteobacteria bacterium]